MSGEFWKVALEKDGVEEAGRSCEKWGSVTYTQGGEEYPAYNKRKEGQILRTNCLLKHVIEGKIEETVQVTGRWGSRRQQLLDDLKETREYYKLKEAALDRGLWRTRFGRGCGPVVKTDYGISQLIK